MIRKEVKEACSGGKKVLVVQFVDIPSFVPALLKCPFDTFTVHPLGMYTPLEMITLSGGNDQTSLKARKSFACHARLEQLCPAKVLKLMLQSNYRRVFLPRPMQLSSVKKVVARCLGFQCCFLMEKTSTKNFVVIKYLDAICRVLWVFEYIHLQLYWKRWIYHYQTFFKVEIN